ncbi:hypothetical protein GF318_04500 [Candidatus Micrarchaeota archaeon]|nr:hypothetical protein [Candidatus Micrarchaeota archaeon]
MPDMYNVSEKLQGAGISEHDALVIADCVVTRKSCSWVNSDPVDERVLQDLNDLIEKEGYKVRVEVQPVPTRSKFIWEVKIL